MDSKQRMFWSIKSDYQYYFTIDIFEISRIRFGFNSTVILQLHRRRCKSIRKLMVITSGMLSTISLFIVLLTEYCYLFYSINIKGRSFSRHFKNRLRTRKSQQLPWFSLAVLSQSKMSVYGTSSFYAFIFRSKMTTFSFHLITYLFLIFF